VIGRSWCAFRVLTTKSVKLMAKADSLTHSLATAHERRRSGRLWCVHETDDSVGRVAVNRIDDALKHLKIFRFANASSDKETVTPGTHKGHHIQIGGPRKA